MASRNASQRGAANKRKGAQGEREFAALIGGTRVPLSGAMGGDYSNDVIAPNGWQVEVKRRKSGLKVLYDWIEDERERPDCVAFRQDRKQWLVVMTAERFIELLHAAKYEDPFAD